MGAFTAAHSAEIDRNDGLGVVGIIYGAYTALGVGNQAITPGRQRRDRVDPELPHVAREDRVEPRHLGRWMPCVRDHEREPAVLDCRSVPAGSRVEPGRPDTTCKADF